MHLHIVINNITCSGYLPCTCQYTYLYMYTCKYEQMEVCKCTVNALIIII